MKKIKIPILVLTLIFIFLTSSMCLAFIPEEECSIAGIRPGDDYQRVLDCYGTPLKMEKNKRGEKYIARIEYNGVIILCESKGSKDPVVRVTNIIVQKNNGWKTPSGIGKLLYTVRIVFTYMRQRGRFIELVCLGIYNSNVIYNDDGQNNKLPIKPPYRKV